MAKLTFYHQVRVDGGKRTGIEIDDTELLHSFQTGDEDSDPTLLWYIDIDCLGDEVPSDPQDSRNWLLANRDFFVGELLRTADQELGAGFDVEVRPFLREISHGPDAATVRFRMSAIRRLVAREMAENVRLVAQQWSALLEQLEFLSIL